MKNCPEEVDWDEFETLSTEPYYYRRCVAEALEIQREEMSSNGEKIINNRAGLYVTTKAWQPLLKKIS